MLTNLYGCTIGEKCVIGAFVEIGPGVIVGDHCRIQAMTYIPSGVVIGNNVFIGPRVTFLNDKYPPSEGAWKTNPPTVIEDNVVIGGCATILPSLTIQEGAFIGAGALLTKNVGKGERWWGTPARRQDSSLTLSQELRLMGAGWVAQK